MRVPCEECDASVPLATSVVHPGWYRRYCEHGGYISEVAIADTERRQAEHAAAAARLGTATPTTTTVTPWRSTRVDLDTVPEEPCGRCQGREWWVTDEHWACTWCRPPDDHGDPRPDLGDASLWRQLLRAARAAGPVALYGSLRGLRAYEASLAIVGGQTKLDAGELERAEYDAIRAEYLVPHGPILLGLLGKLMGAKPAMTKRPLRRSA